MIKGEVTYLSVVGILQPFVRNESYFKRNLKMDETEQYYFVMQSFASQNNIAWKTINIVLLFLFGNDFNDSLIIVILIVNIRYFIYKNVLHES